MTDTGAYAELLAKHKALLADVLEFVKAGEILDTQSESRNAEAYFTARAEGRSATRKIYKWLYESPAA